MARVSMGYPSAAAELEMLASHTAASPLDDLKPVASADDVRRLMKAVRGIYLSDSVKQYAVDLTTATRRSPELRLGASPRATLHLMRAARATAALSGRDHVLPDDVQELAVSVLAHRLLPTADTQLARRSTADVVRDLLTRVRVPGAFTR
jgi:MoxR-like ATPase